MIHDRTGFRNLLTRWLAVMALLCTYGFGLISASALFLAASTHQVAARGGYGHGGFHGGGFHGHGFGFGWGPDPYYGYGGYWPYYGDEGVCSVVRQRVMTRHGWRIRRVSICE